MRRTLSLRWRVILIVAGIPLLLLIPVMFFVGQQFRKNWREQHWSKARVATTQLRRTIGTIEPFVETIGDAPGLNSYIHQIANSVDDFEFVALVDGQGQVLEHTIPGYADTTLSQFRDLATQDTLWLGWWSTQPEAGGQVGLSKEGDGERIGVSSRNFPMGQLHLIWHAINMPGRTHDTLYIVVAERASLMNPPLLPIVIAAALAAAAIVVLIRFSVDRLVLMPLNRIAEGAAIVGAGDLAYRIRLEREDEFGFVARAFNEMAQRLGDLVSRLEQTVAERTEALEHRNAQLEAVSLVGQEAARERNVNTLLESTVNAISEKFGFYHTGIFILDDAGEWAILRAASSEGGQRMLNRGHRLQVGQVGIVGYVAAVGKPRLAFNVGQDAVWFSNPDLPDTRSEMALPMVSEDRIVGVLDIQSDEETAFSDEDVNTLQLMADQVTVALNNARALETMESTLEELQALQVDYSRRGWARVTKRMRPQAYEYDRVDTKPVAPLPVPSDLAEGRVPYKIVMDGDSPVVMEPLRVGEQVLGYLGLSDPQRSWSEEELSLVVGVGEQIALALDNARLFEDTQRNERQQYLISQVLQVASSPELDTEQILEEIAQVLAQGLDLAVGIFTFPYANLPVVHAHAIVDPEGGHFPLFDAELTLSREHHVFFQALQEPALGPMTPWLTEVEGDPEAEAYLERYDFERVFYVPIASAGEQTGFIGLIQDRESPPLDPETRDLAYNLAGQIAVVLDNLNLSEETRRRSEELRQLYRLSLVLSEQLETEEVLELIASEGPALLGAEGSNLWVYEEGTGSLVLSYDSHGGAEGRLGYRMPSDRGLAGQALTEQRTIFIEDYATWDNRVPELVSTRFRAMMATPLIGRYSPLGVLVVLSEQMAVFGEREAGLADLFSAQAATALENTRLTQDAQRRAEEFSQLYEAGIDLITILDVEELLDRAADWTRRVFEAERAIVFLRDPEADRFIRGVSASDAKYLLSHASDQPSAGGLTETIIETQESVLVSDNRDAAMSSARRLVELGLMSQLGAPLRIGAEVLGALFVNGARVNQFTERDLTLLEFLAAQISSALQNAIQFGQTEQALATVGRQARYQSNVSEAVALLNERGTEAISDVLRLLSESAEVPVALYFEVIEDSETDFWRVGSSWIEAGRDPERLGDPRLQRMPVDRLAHWRRELVEEGFVMGRVDTLPDMEQQLLRSFEFNAVLGLAVPGEADSPGFVALFRDQSYELWEEQEVVALQTVAAALSNTLAREHLFEQVEQTLSETEALYRGGAALSEADSYQQILDVLLEHTLLGQDVSSATLQLFDRPWSDDHVPEYADVVAYWSSDTDMPVKRRYFIERFPSSVQVMRSADPVFVEDLAHDTVFDRRAHALFRRVLRAKSVVIVPLVVGGQRVGYLHADYRRQQVFAEGERRRLVSLAQQAAIAVLNIRQLRATQARVQREQLIRQITGQIQQAPDVEGVLQTAVRELGRAFGTSRNLVQFRRPQGEDVDGGNGDSDG